MKSKARNIFVFLSILMLSMGFQGGPKLNEKNTSAMIRASFIYNFAKLVDWPEDYKKGNFVISILGGDKLYSEMIKKYNDKHIGSQQITIKKIPPTTDFSYSQVLFVSKKYKGMINDINKAIANRPTLLISDFDGAMSAGVMINFIIVEHNQRFVLNVKLADAHHLFIGSTLKSLAYHVEE